MKVTFPHMGNIYIPLKTFFELLDIELVLPPPCTNKTLELGVKYSPEFACLPLKLNIGNFIEALEKGADTIVMAGGVGPCRFGYYCEVQKEILKSLGYEFEMIVLEPPDRGVFDIVNKLKTITNARTNSVSKILYSAKIAWKKALLLDKLDKLANKIRAVEINKGETNMIYSKVISILEQELNEYQLETLKKDIVRIFKQIKIDKDKLIPRIAIVGEIYTVLEPFVNLDIERELGKLGVEVNRCIYITDWVKQNLYPSFLKPKEHKKVLEMSKPYINCFIGGHGQETVAQVVNCSKNGYDGVIQLLPFTCMPEIVAKSVLQKVSQDKSIPVMTLVLDEHSAEAGLKTRLEAFVDMIKHKLEVEKVEILTGS